MDRNKDMKEAGTCIGTEAWIGTRKRWKPGFMDSNRRMDGNMDKKEAGKRTGTKAWIGTDAWMGTGTRRKQEQG